MSVERTHRPGLGLAPASSAGRPLILGGVSFADAELGLDGHSDADVLTHAIMDALLGAAGLDDIGVHFPDTRRRLRGRRLDRRCSREVRRDARASGACAIVHVDTTDRSWSARRSGPTAPRSATRLAAALGLDRAHVNVKASTGEGMGFVGRLEGAAALAVVTVREAQRDDL